MSENKQHTKESASKFLLTPLAEKEITITTSKEEMNALTSVLCDSLDFYSQQPNNQEELKILELATSLSRKISNEIYKHP